MATPDYGYRNHWTLRDYAVDVAESLSRQVRQIEEVLAWAVECEQRYGRRPDTVDAERHHAKCRARLDAFESLSREDEAGLSSWMQGI